MDKITLNGVEYVKASGVEIKITKDMVADFLSRCDYYSYIYAIRYSTKSRLSEDYVTVDNIINDNDSDAGRALNMLTIYKATD